MNAAKTTLSTAINTAINNPSVNIEDVVKGAILVFKDEEVKVVKVIKKKNQVVVKGKNMDKAIVVSVNELTNRVLTVEEKVMKEVVQRLKAARKGLAKAEKEFRAVVAVAGSVLTPEYKKAAKARDAALVELRLADAALALTKYGKTLGRHDVKELNCMLNTDELEAAAEEALTNYTDVDKEAGRQLAYIYGLIAVVNIVKVSKAVYSLDPESEYTTALRYAMFNLRMRMSHNTDNAYKNVWHSVFGGVNSKGKVHAVESVCGVPTKAIREQYLAMELEGQSDLVTLDDKGISIRPFTKVEPKRIGLREAVRKLQYVGQVVFIRTLNKENGMTAQISKAMSALQRLVGLHVSGIALEGLANNSRFESVVKVGFHGKTWTGAKVVMDPIAVLKDGEDAYDAEEIAIANTLREAGYSVAATPENYGKHGYVQKAKSYNRREINAFINEDGSSHENMAKLLVRLMKQVWNPGEVQFNGIKTLVVGLVNPEMANLPKDIDVEALKEVNTEVSQAFVAGPAIASESAFSFMGTGRFVTGDEAEASGQKTVVCDPSKTMVKALSHVYFNLGGGHDKQFVIAGLNSTKSAKFKYTDGWKMETFLTEDGKKVALWVKSTHETYKLTYSATANAFRTVDLKVEGVNAALNSLARSTEELKSETATKLIYAKNGKTLFENIQALLSEGRIQYKGHRVATNSQFNLGLEMQHGVAVAKEVVTALVQANIASQFRADVVSALELAEGNVDAADVGEVSAAEIINTIATGCAGLGLPLEDLKGKVLHINIVLDVMKMLAATGKRWINIKFNNDKGVLFPITQDFLDSFEGTSRPMYVALQGLAAELFEAFAFHVQKATETLDEEFGIVTYSVQFTDASIDVSLDKISKARDAIAGKPLNKIPAYGCSLLLATSAHLKGNDVYAPVLNHLIGQAESAYRCHVTVLYFKSPILWKASISATNVVTRVAKGNDELNEWLVQFGGTEEYSKVMQGTCSYISSEKAVKNGNDADGDLNSFLCVPNRSIDGSALSNENFFLDATNPYVAAGAHHYAAKWLEELDGLVLDANKRTEAKLPEVSADDVAELGLEAATDKAFARAFEASIIRSAKEKANVAIFTSHQTTTLNFRGAFQSAFAGALKRVSVTPGFSLFNNWINKLSSDEFALNAASEAFWAFTSDVQGTCVNLDAMDQVKSLVGRNTKKLASLLSSGELKFLNYSYVINLPQNKDVAEKTKVAQNITKAIAQRTDEVYNAMFNPDQHNIAIEQLNHVLPAYTEAEANLVKKMVAMIVVVCGANVGYFAASKYDVCQQVAATASKVNGRAVSANLETLASVQAEKGREKVEIDCVQRTIATIAKEFHNKVLF